MSKWLNDGEVLEGQGSGEAVPVSPRPQSMSAGSPRLARGRSPLSSPTPRKATASPQAATMGKAKQLFVLCDKEGKGFITKRDMQRLQVELPLSPEQLETVFESLDRESNGFLTPLEFSTGLGELMGHNDTTEQSQELPGKDIDQVDWSEDAATIRLTDILNELGADKLSDSQQELCTFWCELQRERPELLRVLEGILLHAVTHLRDSIRERDSLEQALRRRESEHDQVVQSMYEEMENQVREEREKRLAKESIRQKQRGIQVEEELKMRDQELEITLSKQKELESKMQQLICEQANIKEQNQELRSLNVQLQEQAQSSRMQLQAALFQLAQLQLSAAQEQAARQQNMIKVSRNMQKEKDSLLRQLGLLRDMNKRLRDEKDAQLTKNRSPNMEETLQKTGSVVGHYFLQEKPVKRRLSSYDEQEQDTEKIAIDSKASCRVRCERVGQSRLMSPPQHVFKLVFLGSSGVGKSAFIQHYCTGHFCSPRSETAGVDFQMKIISLGSTSITLQLWDTAGQERFRCITDQYYRKADAILVVYDITWSASFTAAREWIDSVEEKMCDGAMLMLLGNKLDLADSRCRKVAEKDGQKLAEQHRASFFECSAKTGANMEELMTHLAEKLIAQLDRQSEDTLSLTEYAAQRSCCM
ncbi:EF-hand calcium-binding domain-containing protein 4A isoform X1 [Phyllopteryx taeniolatus]|uniref:EF-hand calcium-binding domain-containing protein 4A isoform X1 n=1 Tax=Phyllopteryx taeniolatus TaxID=161469 RepID=UPI002AD213F9|nr:EF-hand calcium-binding domain-containing protein 4A isoform X1 [Phyllopteryx taeniolatus]XP_061630556.1 EF-hand calcium-binding domain-containing protein 4A isoform X1 [Phyllopteryx taeniolatus]XP_061630557.1 EF-hand calcium-binding domain-containing protein 4A isoform X1 [Phyllopteryx taeniolatus]XP_061630558.1 EF-hand calcium-binding domain-containing protein 4A isoform X1 [Phyllopteryx taeniolatus]